MKHLPIILLLSLLAAHFSLLPCSAAVPLRWTVETSRLQPAVFDVVRGETLALEAEFKSYGTPVSTSNLTAFLCWQTNGMASAWWVTNAVTTASVAKVLFTPEMDPGAPTVTAFLGLSETTNRQSSLSYRAAFTLRFRHGPGDAPNVIEQPVPILDLAHTVVINPPWPTQADFAATTTVMRAELKDYVDEQIEGAGVVTPQTVTNIVDAKIAAIPKDGVSTNAVQGIIQKNIDTNLLCTVAAAQGIITPVSNDVVRKRGLLDLNVYTNVLNTAPFDSRCVGTDYITWSIVQGVGYVFILHYDCGSRYGESECYLSEGVEIRNPYTNERRVRINYVNSGEGEPELVELLRPYQDLGGTDLYFDKIQETGVLLATENDLPSTNGFVTAGVTNGLASAASVSTLNQGYSRLYSFSTGATNANFTATNYPPTAAAAAAKVHWEPEEGMDFSTVPASLQLNERRDGEWRTVMDTRDWTVWYYRFKERQLTNEIARLKAENAVISNRLETAKAWGNYTANGVDNPLTDTTVVDRPNMWIMADYEWQKCVSGTNSCWVIRAKNAAISGGANTNGFLEICDAFGRPYMRVNKSAETFADAVFSDIHFDDEEGAWYVVFGNQAKPTKGGANCNIVGASSGGGRCILYDEDLPECPATITWPDTADSHAGHWIMKAVPKPVNGVVPTMMFFGAEIKVAGKDYVEYIKEASFGAGIRVGNNVYEAVESGNTLIWQKKVD